MLFTTPVDFATLPMEKLVSALGHTNAIRSGAVDINRPDYVRECDDRRRVILKEISRRLTQSSGSTP